MHVDRDRFLLLAAALSACHQATRQSAAPAPVQSAPVVAQSAAPIEEAPPKPPTFCESIAQQNARLLSNPKGSCPSYREQELGERANLIDQIGNGLFRYCHEGKGVWAVVVVSAELDDAPTGEAPGCGAQATYELIYTQDPGAPASVVKSADRTWDHHPNSTVEPEPEAIIDYDGDGKDELLFSTRSWWNGGGNEDKLEVLRADKAVTAFPLPFRYDATVDADEDGRPDLIQSDYFGTSCLGLADRPVNGTSVLWHSLPNGAFSASDEVARRWAISECPAMPTPMGDDSSDTSCASVLSCQRIWGRSAQTILKGLPKLSVCSNTCVDAEKAKDIVSTPLPYKALNVDTPAPLIRHRTAEPE